MPPARICLIGAGNFARYVHGPMLKELAGRDAAVERAAVCDLNAERAENFARDFGFQRSYTDPEIMLQAEKPDGVVVLTQVAATAQTAGKVLAAGYPVMMEKPPGRNRAEIEHLIAMRQKKGYEGFLTLRYPFIVDSMTSQAAVAALRPGDEIRAVDELRNAEFPEYQKYIASKAGDSVHLEVLRGENTLQIALPVSDEGLIGVVSRSGIYTPRTQKYTFWESIPAGIHRTGEMLSSYWEQLKLIVQPKTKMYEELGGFIAIGSIFPSEWNWQDFWIKTAFLSIILAVMNIIPIPGLDGGHAIFTFWEMITRRKVSEKVLEMAQYVGMFILLMLLLYANGNDIYRFFIK